MFLQNIVTSSSLFLYVLFRLNISPKEKTLHCDNYIKKPKAKTIKKLNYKHNILVMLHPRKCLKIKEKYLQD